MKDRYKKRRELQQLLLTELGCHIQYTGWPCNTCFHSLELAGVDEDKLHELWEATCLIRGDYKNGEFVTMTDKQLSDNIDLLLEKLR